MGDVLVGSIVCALGAALMFAVSATLQQTAARSANPRSTEATTEGAVATPRWAWLPILGMLGKLFRDRRWLAGWVANLVAFGLHATALHLGSIVVVQALLVVQLLFALPMASVRDRHWPMRRDWIGTALICTGLVVLLIVRHGIAQTTARRADAPLVAAVAAGLVVLLLAAARLDRRHGQVRSALVAAGAGICFALTAVFVVLVTDDLARQGPLDVLTDWPVYGVALSTLCSGLLVQDAFASGSLPTALTTMTITDPVASFLAGVVLFDAAAPTGPGAVIGLPLVGLLLAAGVVLLANSPTLYDERRYARPTSEPMRGYPSSSAETVADHGNRSAARRDSVRRASRDTSSSSTTAPARPAGVPSQMTPDPDVVISSPAAPASGTTTGVPHARASSVASPNDSAGDGDSATSASATNRATTDR
jgi:drug/metabolite transporter (DMT)-like permease